MDNFKLIKKFLSKGLCLKIIYYDENKNEKFLILANSTWINKTNFFEEKFEDDIIIDFLFKEKVTIENLNISSIEYINLPDNFIISEIDNSNYDESLIKINLKHAILHFHLTLDEHLFRYGLDKVSIYRGKEITKDQIIVSTYPNHQYYIDNISSFKQDIIKTYFYVKKPTQPVNDKDYILSRCLDILNIPYENKDITDDIYISSMIKFWSSLILEQKERMLNSLKNEDFLTSLTEEEKREYEEEIEIYNKKLNKDHSENLNKLKTIKDIISYWPSELQPIPDFVYYEY
jgi:hypothetical protein